MAKEIVSDEVAAGFAGFASMAQPSTADEGDALKELLEGNTDDEEAVEAGAGELAVLEDEFGVVAALTRRKEELEGQLSKVNQQLAAQKQRMLDAMDAQGTAQFKSAGGPGACSPTTTFDTKVEDPATFMAWVQEFHPELLTVNSQTRSSFIRKEYRDKGVDPDSPEFPPGIVASERRSLTVRGVKRGKTRSQ